MDGPLKRTQGFSLAEYLLALALLAMVALSLLAVFGQGNKLIQDSADMATADELASGILEDVKRSVALDGLAALPGLPFAFDGRVPDPVSADTNRVFPPSPYPSNKLGPTTYRIQVEGKAESAKLVRVEVTVFWNEDKKIRLSTLLYPRS